MESWSKLYINVLNKHLILFKIKNFEIQKNRKYFP